MILTVDFGSNVDKHYIAEFTINLSQGLQSQMYALLEEESVEVPPLQTVGNRAVIEEVMLGFSLSEIPRVGYLTGERNPVSSSSRLLKAFVSLLVAKRYLGRSPYVVEMG